MRKALVIISILLIANQSYSQNLADLKSLMASTSLNEADNILSKWGFKYKTSIISDTLNKLRTTFYESDNAVVTLTKEEINDLRLFHVQYVTKSDIIFNRLKNECLTIKDCKFVNEKIDPDGSFTRTYNDGQTIYVFIINPIKGKSSNQYSIIVHI